ncbi:tyrosine-type recombinase/integrase [Streptacidiphilus cavernicola]|uniref:Tyrosine-type recombinase/integrase n=1 Tax=Streptacidiphilus cavernicola TaxID=3342716 RepID=A0ABV6W3A5_9ACTN
MTSAGTEFERGRVYRRCGCKDAERKELGPSCPKLADDPGHGSWAYAVDLPTNGQGRGTRRRSGFASREDAVYKLQAVLNAQATGVHEDAKLTMEPFLLQWLKLKKLTLKPSTASSYDKAVHNDLLPAFGRMRLVDLTPQHVTDWMDGMRDRERGAPTVYRLGATLRSALSHAQKVLHLVQYNAAKDAMGSRPKALERTCWDPMQAAAFLRHNTVHYNDQLADLFEVMLGTGMRRGEVLGLHWGDVHFMERTLFVRWTLATIDNNELHLCEPKTKASRNWVSLNPRVMAALHRQAAVQQALLPPGAPLEGLVFGRVDGAPLRPQYVLDQLRKRLAEAKLPKITLHDLRHTAATIMISSGVPIAIVSKMLRHSTIATTINIYGHLLKYAADDAATALAQAYDKAEAALEDWTGPRFRTAA